MDNLHRELAPVSAAAWVDLEDEARRTAHDATSIELCFQETLTFLVYAGEAVGPLGPPAP